jgi:hypothetical protein
LAPAGALRRRPASRPDPRRARPRRSRSTRPRRADGAPGVAPARSSHSERRAHPAFGPGPVPLGSAPHPPRPRRARSGRGPRPTLGSLHAPVRDRRLPCASGEAGGHRLEAHRRPLRRARRADALTGRRAESRRRASRWPSAPPRA